MADAATWAKRIAEWRASGLTAREFCETREFAASGLYWWSSHLGRSSRSDSDAPVRLARVVRRRSSAALEARAAPKPAEIASGVPSLMIELAGARVFVGAGVQRATLDVVLDALRERARGGHS